MLFKPPQASHVVREIDPCLLASCRSAVHCDLEQPKVWCLVMVLFVFV